MKLSLHPYLVTLGVLCTLLPLAAPDPTLPPPTSEPAPTEPGAGPVTQLIARLAADRAADRDAAADALLACGPAVLPQLLDAAASDDPALREHAAALIDLLSADATDRARRRDAARLVRHICRHPSALRPGSDVDDLFQSLLPESAAALASAARSQAALELVNPDFVRTLARHPTDAALTTLADLLARGRLTPSSVLRAAADLRDARSAGAEPGPALGDIEALLELPSAPLRRAAVALFAAAGGPRVAPRVAALLDDPDEGVRVETVRALGALAPASHAGALQRAAADDPSRRVRAEALEALRAVPGRPTPGPALRSADDPWPCVRAAAARLLERDATPECVSVLRNLTRDPSAQVRGAAQRALRGLGVSARDPR